MTTRAIRTATRMQAEQLAAKVDGAHGYPRCENLAGRIEHFGGGRHATCACTDVEAPDPSCVLATRAETESVELADGTWAYPVREGEPETMAALSKSERGAIVDVPETDRRRAPVAAATKPTDTRTR